MNKYFKILAVLALVVAGVVGVMTFQSCNTDGEEKEETPGATDVTTSEEVATTHDISVTDTEPSEPVDTEATEEAGATE